MMKQPSIVLLSVLAVVSALLVYFGLSEKKLLFIATPRAAAIALAVVGIVMCSVGVLGLYMNKAPGHPFAIAGYLLGCVALLAAIAQVFRVPLPIVSDPKAAIIVIGSVILIKFVIGRFSTFLTH